MRYDEEYHAYHIVSKHELNSLELSPDISYRCTREVRKRIEFTNKYYQGHFDEAHTSWMLRLITHIDSDNKVTMTLDELGKLYNLTNSLNNKIGRRSKKRSKKKIKKIKKIKKSKKKSKKRSKSSELVHKHIMKKIGKKK
jgi:seryl-tRNA synthetase